MVNVGWMLSWRWTICWPVWLMLFDAPSRIAWARLFSRLLVPASAPMLSSVERTAALNSMPQWLSTSSSSPTYPSVLAPGCRSSAIDMPSGMMMRVQTSSTRALPEGNRAIVLPDQLRPLGNKKILAGGAVIDSLRHLGGDLARQIGTYAGDQRGRDDRASLHDIWRRLRFEPIGTDRAPIGRSVEEGGLAVLHVLCGASIDRRRRTWGRRRSGRCARDDLRDAPRLLVGLGEELAQPRRLDLLGSALRFRIGRRRRNRCGRRGARIEHRPAEIAGQCRPKWRRLPREPGIILR